MKTFSVLPFFSTFEAEFESLFFKVSKINSKIWNLIFFKPFFFDKLDVKETGFVNFKDFCNHLIIRYKEREFYDSLKTIPFNNKLKIKFSSHNRVIICAQNKKLFILNI